MMRPPLQQKTHQQSFLSYEIYRDCMSDYNRSSILQNWKPFTLVDAYKPRQPIQYLVGNLFEIPSLNMIFGAPGSMKSFLVADLAICISSGNVWLPSLPSESGIAMPVMQGSVAWLDFENGKRRTHERFSALGRTLQLPSDTPLYYYSMSTPWLDAKKRNQIEELADLIQEHQAILVVIDNLGTISGGADENSTEMIEVMANLRWLVEETGAAFIVIHHRRKSDAKNGRAGDALRGHSSIEAALDLALLVDRENTSQIITIKPTKVRGAVVQPFSATFTYLHDDWGELKEARFFSAHGDGVTVVAQRWKVIYQCAGDKPMNKTALTQLAYDASSKNYPINLLGRDIDMMVQQGHLLQSIGTNNAHLLIRNPAKAL